MVNVGDRVMLIPENTEQYPKELYGKVFTVTHASRDGPGYDRGLYPEKLLDLNKGFPGSVYEYEVRVVKRKR